MKRIEIFRAGSHTSMSGETLSFSDSVLGDIAQGYDPALHEAPIVIGHPKTDAPAYGWVEGLAVEGDRLVAAPRQVDPAFADLVEAGRYKKVSASFYLPTSPNNPTPGRHYLKHVGFLGAKPPAVKGLRQAEFGENEADVVTIEFSDGRETTPASHTGRLFSRLRDWLIGSAGLDTADQVLPAWEVSTLADLPDTSDTPAYAEDTMDKDELAAREEELQRREAEIATREAQAREREAAFAERETQRLAAEDAAFVTAEVAAGRLPKVLEETAVALFAELTDAGEVSFADGGETRTGSAREALKALISQLPLPVVPVEIVKGEVETLDFEDAEDVAGAITAEIRTAAEAGQQISAADALVRLRERGGK